MTRWMGPVLVVAVVAAAVAAGAAPTPERAAARTSSARAARAKPPAHGRRPAPPPAAPVEPAPPPEPIAYYVVAADTDTELAARDADRQWPPASMTKMMTVLLALEQVRAGKRTLAEPVRVSKRAAEQGGSQVFLRAGEVISLGDMLAATMIPSANDAAVAVAEHLAGSTDAFVRRMNARARALGLTRTVYRTPNGLPLGPGLEPDLTTARDLARVARELMRYPEALGWSGTTETTMRNGTFAMHNTNRLLTRFAGATGLKTGHTSAAGFSVTASATRGDLTLVAVVLGLPTRSACFDVATRVLGDAFDRYRVVVAARPGMAIGTVPVTGGIEGSVKALPERELRVVVPRSDERQLIIEQRIPRQIAAPVVARQPLGTLVVRRGTEEVGSVPVMADAGVEQAGWLAWLWPGGRPAAAAR